MCIDGHHRLLAHSILDNQDIQCRIFEGSYDEAVDYAFQANLTNGLPLTIKEKKLYASKLLTNHPEMSSRAIGRLSGLSHDTVQDLRNPSTNPPSKPKIARPVIEKILNLAWDMKFSKDENPVSEGRTFLQSWDEDQQEHYREAIVNLINVLADVDDLG